MSRATWMLIAAGALGAVFGCVGRIGDPEGEIGKPPSVIENAPDPGRVTLHRLNRAEYDNTVRDLLGTALTPAKDFPNDDHTYGFDNIADALTLSTLQLELYERAADDLAHEALSIPVLSATQVVEAESLTSTVGASTGDAWLLWSNGEVSTPIAFPSDGDYKISARVWGDQMPPDPAQMSIKVGAQTFGPFDVGATSASPIVVEQMVTLKQGTHDVAVEFLNDDYDPDNNLDRNLYVDWIRVEGPIGATGTNPLRERIVTCDPVAGGKPCIEKILGDFGARAWRRPLTPPEVDGLVAFVDLAAGEGGDVNEGLELAVHAALVSPHFIFRVEIDPDPTSPDQHLLGDYELASRLSYFLWSSMPDDALFAAAAAGKLQDPDEIAAQVDRMLADPRSDALIDNFAGQWLLTRALADHTPDYQKFPSFDAPLRDAMAAESRLFFGELLHGDAGLDTLFGADFTYLNDRLATHYGLPPVGSDMKRVTLASDQRGGLFKQSALLMVTSYTTRTSPVKRGKFILTNLLCAEPPPPPPGVEGIVPEEVPTGSFREKLEQHIADPVCASCHHVMDDLGFALDHYDAIGAWRDNDSGFAIDATGEVPGAGKFDGATEMTKLLVKDPRLDACAAQKMLTYALGRGPTAADKPYLDGISHDFADRGRKLRELVKLIATSDPFRMRRGEPGGDK